MLKLLQGSVESDGVKIKYYRTGDEKQAVILLHAACGNGLTWNNLPILLEPEYDVIALDARGHGFSDAPEHGYSPDDHARDVAAVIRTLGLNMPILIGHSMGAQTAAQTALRYPDLVKALVLEDPPWNEEKFGRSPQQRSAMAEATRERIMLWKEKTLDEMQAICRREHPTWDESETFQWAKSHLQVSPAIASGMLTTWLPWMDIVELITCPALLITSDPERGGIMTPQDGEKVNQINRKFKHVTIPDAGHHIHREQFDAYMDELNRFLASQRQKRGFFESIFRPSRGK